MADNYVNVTTDAGFHRITAACERLGAAQAEAFLNQAAAAAVASGGCAVLDLAPVRFIDSSGVGALVALARRVRAAHCGFAVYGARPEVHSVLRLMKLEPVVGIAPGLEQALDLARRGQV
jgi:anti-sigma B factor antagonist